MAKKKKPVGLFANINRRKRAGTSRPKSKSTIDPKTYRDMKTWGKKKRAPRKKKS